MNALPLDFDCDGPSEGFYSESEQYWTIRPRREYHYDAGRDWLCIGGPGVDGIEFGLLLNKNGVFAYYPMSNQYVWKADSVSLLIAGWISGEITV